MISGSDVQLLPHEAQFVKKREIRLYPDILRTQTCANMHILSLEARICTLGT